MKTTATRPMLFGTVLGLMSFLGQAADTGPAFSCARVSPGSIEARVCERPRLAALDRQLDEAYRAALKKATDEAPPRLKVEQRGWIKGRNDCWKSDAVDTCIEQSYVLRIAELQARYRLVRGTGPVFYTCDGPPASEVVDTFFQTVPPSLIDERADSSSFMVLQPSASGARYQGGNESLWEHQGAARIVWGFGAAEMRCTVRR